MKKVSIKLILVVCVFSSLLFAQNTQKEVSVEEVVLNNIFSGNWIWDKNNDLSSFSLSLFQNNQEIKGGHCGVAQSGRRIDCSDEGEFSIVGNVTDNIAVVYYTSSYSLTTGTAQLKILPNGKLEWKVLQPASGQTFLPEKAILSKSLDCDLDSDNDGYNDCEDPNNAVNNTTITSNFTEDKGGWRNNGSVAATLEEGRLKVSNVDSSWEGINRPLDALNIVPGQQLNISLDFDQGDTSANVRLYVQEQDAEGNHLSWNVINGKLQTRTYKYVYTIKAGYKAILRIDKDNTHLEETTHFYVDNIEVKLLDCTLDSDGDGYNDCEDRCPSIVGPSLGGVGFNNGCPFEVEHTRDPLLPRN